MITCETVMRSSTNNDLADPSSPNTLMNIFLIEASFIFSIANRIFSAFSIAAELGFKVSYSLFEAKEGVGSTTLFSFRRIPAWFPSLDELLSVQPFDPFPLLEEMLSQKAESLSGLSVLLFGVAAEF